ncbi:MAG: dihydrofolate reductase [Clostridia bacterium]|nr:dihydrofolate reductase [Clostridia bacterium]
MTISIIAAVGKNLELGKNNRLLWRLKGDLPFFKRVTEGHPVIMGLNTFRSLPGVLPGRLNIVLCDDESIVIEGVCMAYSIPEALEKCADANEVFIIGGGMVYKQFLPMADRLYLTEAEAQDPDADVYFPRFAPDLYTRTVLDEGGDEIRYLHVLYERKEA